MTFLTILMLSTSCGEGSEPTSDSAASPEICDALESSQALWQLQAEVLEDGCGLGVSSWELTYGLEHVGLGMTVHHCDYSAGGTISGCSWTYASEDQTFGALGPGLWDLEGEGLAWEEPVSYCEEAMPAGLDWETEEVWTLQDPQGGAGEEDCELIVSVTGAWIGAPEDY